MPTRHVVVGALVIDRGRLLLSQRREDQILGLMWELPGGKVEPGESPEEALRRELREELDVDAEVGRIYDVLFHRYPEFDVLLLVYACKLLGQPSAHLVRALRWYAPHELSDLPLLPADAPLAARLSREGLP